MIDASAALAFVLTDGPTGHDLQPVRALLRQGGGAVPAVFMPEILHVLVKTERRTRGISPALDEQLQTIKAMRLTTDDDTALHLESRSLPLARGHCLSIFDAT